MFNIKSTLCNRIKYMEPYYHKLITSNTYKLQWVIISNQSTIDYSASASCLN